MRYLSYDSDRLTEPGIGPIFLSINLPGVYHQIGGTDFIKEIASPAEQIHFRGREGG